MTQPLTETANEKLTDQQPFEASVSVRPDTRFKPGNQAALRHGLYAAKPVEVLPAEVQEDIEKFRAAVLGDLGGGEALTAIEDGYVRRLCDVEAVVQLSVLNITRNGFTAKSEGMLLQAVDRWDRIASRLGTKRRSRDIKGMTAEQYAAQAQEEQR